MDERGSEFMFKPVQYLGIPKLPPQVTGKRPAALKFIIPNLRIAQQDSYKFIHLAKNCGFDLFAAEMESVHKEKTNEPATLVTFSFYIEAVNDEEKVTQTLQNTSSLLIERFLGLLSFCAGIKCSAVHKQITISDDQGKPRTILGMAHRSSIPPIKILIPEEIYKNDPPSDVIFSALFWLRRGLAERDPIETFSSFMVCLQILARELVAIDTKPNKCPSCRADLGNQNPSITSLVKELVVNKLNASPDLFSRIWKMRNSVVAHGNKAIIDSDVFLELTELKFEVASLAFQAINIALNIPSKNERRPNQAFFATDAFMYVD